MCRSAFRSGASLRMFSYTSTIALLHDHQCSHTAHRSAFRCRSITVPLYSFFLSICRNNIRFALLTWKKFHRIHFRPVILALLKKTPIFVDFEISNQIAERAISVKQTLVDRLVDRLPRNRAINDVQLEDNRRAKVVPSTHDTRQPPVQRRNLSPRALTRLHAHLQSISVKQTLVGWACAATLTDCRATERSMMFSRKIIDALKVVPCTHRY